MFNIFKKKNKITKKELFSIPCDYDGYDLVFEEGVTDSKLYGEFNDIITDGKLSINKIKEYEEFMKNMNEDTFYTFYDSWINKLKSSGYVATLNADVDIKSFVIAINKMLELKGESVRLNVDEIVEKYITSLKEYVIYGKEISDNFNYDILEANIVALQLRDYGYELICLFNGFDNNIKTIVKTDDISKLKSVEERI